MSQLSTVAETMWQSNRIGDYTEMWWLRSFDGRLRRRLRPRRKHRVGETVTSSADQLGNRMGMRGGDVTTPVPIPFHSRLLRPNPNRKYGQWAQKSRLLGLKNQLFGPKSWLFGPKTLLFTRIRPLGRFWKAMVFPPTIFVLWLRPEKLHKFWVNTIAMHRTSAATEISSGKDTYWATLYVGTLLNSFAAGLDLQA